MGCAIPKQPSVTSHDEIILSHLLAVRSRSSWVLSHNSRDAIAEPAPQEGGD